MSVATARPNATFRPLQRFFRTPKGILLLTFAPLLVIAVEREGGQQALPGLVLITTTAAVLDAAAYRLVRRRWTFPSGAILTGLIIAMVLAPTTSAPIEVATAAIAIASKFAFRTRFSNVFNPAAVALVASSLLFDTAQSWWGALPDLGVPAIVILIVCGVFIADRVNKLPLLLAFLGSYVVLFTAASFVLDPGRIAEIFREPDVEALLFFAFFMLDDPPTCPARYKDQVQFGILVALMSYVLFVANGAVYFLPAGLLLGNAWESARRVVTRPKRASGGA
jgi:Na+-translocating ferredoxin:NAD+ oxidoreductase RnfD subunit